MGLSDSNGAIPSQVWLENLSKTNPRGTQLNDEPIEKVELLEHEDVISICGRRFRFEYGVRRYDGMHYCAGSQTASDNGDKVTYGQLGTVVGFDSDGDPIMKFPGNKDNIPCPLTRLSLNPPVRVGWWVWWVKSGVEGGV